MFSNLIIEKICGEENGRQLWRLNAPLEFSLKLNGVGGFELIVPRGYVTDFASVPRFLWPIVPPTGPWCEASVMHDYLCQVPACSRFFADTVFREAMAQLGVPVWRRVLMYYAVRFYSVFFSRSLL